MNFNFYIFGTPHGRYNQYPEDYTAPTLISLRENLKGVRLIIQRELNLVHYIFYEKIDKENIIGLCLIFNGTRILRPKQLVTFFRLLIESRLIESGAIIKYDNKGELHYSISTFKESCAEYKKLRLIINDEFENNSEKYVFEQLSGNYNGNKTSETVDFSLSDDEIIQSTNKYNTVFVNHESGIEHGYIPHVINSLREENVKNSEHIQKLIEDNEILKKKKKQYRYIVLLSLIILGCFAGLYFFYNDVNDKAEHIVRLEKTITNKNAAIDERENTISELRISLENLRDKIGTLSSYKLSTGSTIRNSDNQDNAWILWIKAKQKVRIESFYIKSKTSGSVDIGLYDTNDILVASVETNVYENEFRKVMVDSEWTIDNGAYYMKIRSGVSLQYHGSNDGEYNQFTGGALEVTGACSYSERSDDAKKTNHSYYQYFYNIQYRIVMDE